MSPPDAPGSVMFPVNCQLVPVAVVRALRGVSADQVTDLADSGELRFVWNISSNTRAMITERRFWLREAIAPASVAHLALPDAIRIILGENRTRWRGTELAQMLMVSRPHIFRLNHSRALPGRIKDRTLWVERPALQKFLVERVCYN